jgi:hypothetical protein
MKINHNGVAKDYIKRIMDHVLKFEYDEALSLIDLITENKLREQ